MTTEYKESMARVQPVLSATELALVDQMAELTHSKRTDVIKNALAVYHWFVRQALTGGRVIAQRPCRKSADRIFRPRCFSICSIAFRAGRSLPGSLSCSRHGSIRSPMCPRVSGTSAFPP